MDTRKSYSSFETGEYVEVECEGDKMALTKTANPKSKNNKSVVDLEQLVKVAKFIDEEKKL